MTKYITTKSTTVLKSNPQATGDWNQSLAVRTLPQGTVIDVISEGQTQTSWSITPTLNIGNGEWINKSDATLYTSFIPNTSDIPTPVKVIGGILAGIALLFVLPKIFK
ncbi:MAG: hypothetical protein H3C45_04385 [Bacteroidia bacterium]|nr:hypothetical protein [Bacteroidia bacterium]HRE63627.1 hypothetical protein [Ferruginibacter sp.]